MGCEIFEALITVGNGEVGTLRHVPRRPPGAESSMNAAIMASCSIFLSRLGRPLRACLSVLQLLFFAAIDLRTFNLGISPSLGGKFTMWNSDLSTGE